MRTSKEQDNNVSADLEAIKLALSNKFESLQKDFGHNLKSFIIDAKFSLEDIVKSDEVAKDIAKSDEVAKDIAKSDEVANNSTNEKYTFLELACKYSCKEIVEKLLNEMEVHPTKQVLSIVIETGNTEIASLVFSKAQQQELIDLAYRGLSNEVSVDIVKVLLDAIVDEKENEAIYILFHAAESGNLEVMKFLHKK